MPQPIVPEEVKVELKTLEYIKQAILDSKLLLTKIQQAYDKTVLERVRVEKQCLQLESRQKEEEKKIQGLIQEIDKYSQEIKVSKHNLATEAFTLKKIQEEKTTLLSQIQAERLNIAQEMASSEVRRRETEEKEKKLILSQVDNEIHTKKNAEQVKKIKEFASLL